MRKMRACVRVRVRVRVCVCVSALKHEKKEGDCGRPMRRAPFPLFWFWLSGFYALRFGREWTKLEHRIVARESINKSISRSG